MSDGALLWDLSSSAMYDVAMGMVLGRLHGHASGRSRDGS